MDMKILTIDGRQYDYEVLKKVGLQGPMIQFHSKEVLALGLTVSESDLCDPFKVRDHDESYRLGEILLFKYHGYYLLLSGLDKYTKAIANARDNLVSGKLVSTPLLKRTRIEASTEESVSTNYSHTPVRPRYPSHSSWDSDESPNRKPSRDMNTRAKRNP